MNAKTPSPAPSATEELIAPMRPFLPQRTETKILMVVLLVLSLWAMAIITFGVPALVWPMKVIVPLAVAALVAITWGM
jgi:hypothetical protein